MIILDLVMTSIPFIQPQHSHLFKEVQADFNNQEKETFDFMIHHIWKLFYEHDNSLRWKYKSIDASTLTMQSNELVPRQGFQEYYLSSANNGGSERFE